MAAPFSSDEASLVSAFEEVLERNDPVVQEANAQPSSGAPPAEAPAEDPAAPEPAAEPEPEASTDPEASVEEPAEESDEDEGGLDALDDIAKGFEVTPEQFLDSVAITGPDGEPVPLSEAIKPWRDGASPQSELNRYQQERLETLERERSTYHQGHAEALQRVQALTSQMMAKLETGPTDAQLAELKASDPAGYAAALAERAETQRLAEQGIRELEAQRNQDEQRMAQEHGAYVQRELSRLHEAWGKDLKTQREWKARMDEVQSDLVSLGFHPDEIAGINDHRIFLLAHEAGQFRRLKDGVPAVRKRLRKTPKLNRVEARREASANRNTRLGQSLQRLRRTGSPDAAQDWFRTALAPQDD